MADAGRIIYELEETIGKLNKVTAIARAALTELSVMDQSAPWLILARAKAGLEQFNAAMAELQKPID